MNVGLEILIPENVSFHMLLEYLSYRNGKNQCSLYYDKRSFKEDIQ